MIKRWVFVYLWIISVLLALVSGHAWGSESADPITVQQSASTDDIPVMFQLDGAQIILDEDLMQLCAEDSTYAEIQESDAWQ